MDPSSEAKSSMRCGRRPGPRDMPPQVGQVKAHLQAAQELLVNSLYNTAPLLDRMLAEYLLSWDNYQQVQAERTPQDRARRLLEVVQAQMDEQQAGAFLECLRACQNHYPRLRTWLHSNADFEWGVADLQRGAAERRLRAQLAELCRRLGVSVVPVSLQLFSGGTLTQLELDKVQAEPTAYQQTQKLLVTCLSKGESACEAFYQALCGEDPQLGTELQGGDKSASGWCSMAVEESGTAPTAGQNTAGTWEATPFASEKKGILQEVLDLLGIASRASAQLNICQLGVLVGLRREDVRERLLDDAGTSDGAQLSTLVTLFLEKTKDASRLLQRLQQCDTQWVRLSGRGSLLLQLLGEAECLLQAGHSQTRVGHIFTILLWDMLAEIVEEPWVWQWAEPWAGLLGVVRELRRMSKPRAEAELLAELEECWRVECGAGGLLQAVPVLAQLLRDLYPQQDSLQLLGPPHQQGEAILCRPRLLHRVTRFRGVPRRAVTRVLGGLPPPSASLQSQYHAICSAVAQLLDRVCPTERDPSHMDQAPTCKVVGHTRAILSQPAFGPDAFDSGIRHRLLALLEFDPVVLELPTLLLLHRNSLGALESYLQPGEHHGFLLHPEAVWLPMGGAHIRWVGSITGPVAIDDGLEDTFQFVFSGPVSVLVRLCCHGYKDGRWFQAAEPHCICVSGLGVNRLAELQKAGLQVMWEEKGCVWVRKDELSLVGTSPTQLQEAGICFLLRTPGPQCEVRFVYKLGQITAVAKSNCEVL